MTARDRLAAALTLAGLALLVVGAGLTWGIGAALLVAGLALAGLGVLVGWGDAEPEVAEVAQLHPSRRSQA